jgi:hypothetical protein
MVLQDIRVLEDAALAAMAAKVEALHVKGVAAVAIAPPDQPETFYFGARICGRFERPPDPSRGENDKGTNFFSIVFTKLAEMVATRRNSGESPERILKKGEFGYKGGLISEINGLTIMAAFSGGSESEDLEISRAGIAALQLHYSE